MKQVIKAYNPIVIHARWHQAAPLEIRKCGSTCPSKYFILLKPPHHTIVKRVKFDQSHPDPIEQEPSCCKNYEFDRGVFNKS